jgi:hypothetical protein
MLFNKSRGVPRVLAYYFAGAKEWKKADDLIAGLIESADPDVMPWALPILGKRSCRVMHCASAAFAAGAVKRGFDMVMLTSDLSCMIAGARMQLDEFKAKTA